MLATLIEIAQEQGLIKSLVRHVVEKCVGILPYADDTILMIHDDFESPRDLKFILSCFEQMCGLKINFHKREVLC